MRNAIKYFGIIVLVTIIGVSFAACDDGGGDDSGDGKYWLISSQSTYPVEDGTASNYYSSTYYDWIAYRYANETDYEEEYTTTSDSSNSSSNGSYSYYSNTNSYSEYHYTRNGQTSYSTAETISRIYSRGSATLDTVTVSSVNSSTIATYDTESGLTATISTGTTTTIYAIDLLSNSDGLKTYKYNPVGGIGYYIYKIQNGRTLEVSYYDDNASLIYTTTYTQPDNAEIRSKLPNFTLYSTTYHASTYSINSSYQTVEVLPREESWQGSNYLGIRVKTFNDGVLSSQTDYDYYKQSFNVSGDGGNSVSEGAKLPDGVPEGGTLGQSGDYRYYEVNNEIIILRYTRKDGNANIPAQINGKPVTGIGTRAFGGCYKLNSVTIPNSVTRIGGDAFDRCWSLTSITIPDSVQSIEWTQSTEWGTHPTSPFSDCASLSNVTIGNGVTGIGEAAFGGCRNLTSVIIGSGVTSIGEQAFDCYKLTSVTFKGDNVTDIAESSFYGDLHEKYLTGGKGTYTTTAPVNWDSVWTKQ
jgi:hypothetical protein